MGLSHDSTWPVERIPIRTIGNALHPAQLLQGLLLFVGVNHKVTKQVLLNPDCGFAPHHGEPPQVDEAFNKLKALADAARLLRLRASGKNIRGLLHDKEHGPVSHRYHLRTEE
jgi:hypothetical protein